MANRESDGNKSGEEPSIKQSAPGANLCEKTALNVDYWKRSAFVADDRATAVLCMEQAANAWKNLAYSLARQIHFSEDIAVPVFVLDVLTCVAQVQRRNKALSTTALSALDQAEKLLRENVK